MARDLTVIVVSHESDGDLGTCLASVCQHQGPIDCSVVVSDAGSTDETAEVAARFPVVFLPGRNNGFAAGNNRALAHPAARESRYTLFLNPDTEILDGTLAELLAACDARPQSGLFAVRQVDQHGQLSPNLWHFPALRRYAADAVAIGPFGIRRPDLASYEREGPFECADWILPARPPGGARRRRRVDERFFLFHEEFDLCRRAWLAGFSSHTCR